MAGTDKKRVSFGKNQVGMRIEGLHRQVQVRDKPDSSMNAHPYAFLALFLAVAFAFPVIMLFVARLWARTFQHAKPSKEKNSTYECGIVASGNPQIQFKAHYYLYAILFLIFDVEILFLLPFSVAFAGLSTGPLIVMAVFILLLAEGLVWAWANGHLEWK